MEIYIERIFEYLLETNDLVLYGFLMISAVVENLLPPIPGDTITAFGAFLVGKGRLSYGLVYLSTTVGSVIGFMLLFLLGGFLGREFFEEKDYKYFPAQKIRDAEGWFSRYGYFVVLLNRFLPGIRSVISLASGISKLNRLKVFMLALLSASVWNLIWIHAGYTIGENWETVRDQISGLMKKYNIAVSIIIGIMVVIYLVNRIIKGRKKAGEGNS